MTVRPRALLLVLVILATAYVAEEAVRTLRILDLVEGERDGWQRPDAILAQLGLQAGHTVVDLGAGAGYFSLKIAPRVEPSGRVVAVDLRRQSLAFLWARARLRRLTNIQTVVGTETDPLLPQARVDAALIANTFHELSAPDAVLEALSAATRPRGRLVIVDRRPRASPDRGDTVEHHEIGPDVVLGQVLRHGYHLVLRDDRFIDRPSDDDIWWLLAFERE